MPTRKKEDLNPILAEAYVKASAIWKERYPNESQPFIGCAGRSCEEQKILYSYPVDGKDNNGNGRVDEKGEFVTKAKPGTSPHNFFQWPVKQNLSQAFDIGFINLFGKLDWNPDLFLRFALIIEEVSPLIEWGGIAFRQNAKGQYYTGTVKEWVALGYEGRFLWRFGFVDAPHWQTKGWRKYVVLPTAEQLQSVQ